MFPCCFTSIYLTTIFSIRDRNGKKVTQLCSVIPAIAPNGEFFTTVFNFDDFAFCICCTLCMLYFDLFVMAKFTYLLSKILADFQVFEKI